MTDNDQKRSAAYSRSVNKRKLVEAIGFDTVVFRIDDDDPATEFYFPHPLILDKDTKKALKPLEDDDADGIAKVLLGDEQYARFIEQGGDPEDILESSTLVQLASQKALRSGTPLKG